MECDDEDKRDRTRPRSTQGARLRRAAVGMARLRAPGIHWEVLNKGGMVVPSKRLLVYSQHPCLLKETWKFQEREGKKKCHSMILAATPVVLNWDDLLPLRDAWQCLETSGVVTRGEGGGSSMLLVSSG